MVYIIKVEFHSKLRSHFASVLKQMNQNDNMFQRHRFRYSEKHERNIRDIHNPIEKIQKITTKILLHISAMYFVCFTIDTRTIFLLYQIFKLSTS